MQRLKYDEKLGMHMPCADGELVFYTEAVANMDNKDVEIRDLRAEIKLLENNYEVAAQNEQALKDEVKRLRDELEKVQRAMLSANLPLIADYISNALAGKEKP